MLDPNAPCLEIWIYLDGSFGSFGPENSSIGLSPQELAGEFEGSLRPAGRVVRGAKDHPQGHGTGMAPAGTGHGLLTLLIKLYGNMMKYGVYGISMKYQ